MKILIGADIVPTDSNIELFSEGKAEHGQIFSGTYRHFHKQYRSNTGISKSQPFRTTLQKVLRMYTV